MELNGWTSRQMPRRYDASARIHYSGCRAAVGPSSAGLRLRMWVTCWLTGSRG
jgi:hypothetical protein